MYSNNSISSSLKSHSSWNSSKIHVTYGGYNQWKNYMVFTWFVKLIFYPLIFSFVEISENCRIHFKQNKTSLFHWNNEPWAKKKWTLNWTQLLFRRNAMLSYFIRKPLVVGGGEGRPPFLSPSKCEVSFGLKWRQKVEYLPKTFANFVLLSQLSEINDCTEVGFCTVLMFWIVGMGCILKKETESHKDPIDTMLINDLCI